jgi:multiple sugar transport system permease protein
MSKRKAWKFNGTLPWIMLFVSLSGFGFFYLIPFLVSFFYSVIDNPISKTFCGLQNYKELFQNMYFLRGLKNTLVFMAVSIPLNMVLSLGVALVLQSIKRYSNYFSLIFLIPLAIPSATSAFFWKSFFGLHGTLNKFLAVCGINGIDWLESQYGMMVMVIIFIWKNIGYNMALYLSGLSNIPEEYYEVADVEGAGKLWKLRHITLEYLTPTNFLVLIMTFVNSFKVFKEIYIITGEYPPENLYVLQHYMNNMFLSLNYSKLVSATYILTVTIVLFVVCIFRVERKISDDLHY